ncbi:MAG: Rieske (2Fe-2S) protein [Pedobacter sp.]|jgi:3-phenylpropionate/trans-cinnamate dioxygenase ferredoxin subunit
MNWYKVLPPEIRASEDFIKTIQVAGRKLCIVKVADQFYAVQNKCPHAGADLSGGWCTSGKLVCPYHRHEFDLKTGRGAEGQGDYIDTYPLELREDGLYIGIAKPWWKFW